MSSARGAASCVVRVPLRQQRMHAIHVEEAERCACLRSAFRSLKGVADRLSFGNTNHATTAAGWAGSRHRLSRMRRAGTFALTVQDRGSGRSTTLAEPMHSVSRSSTIAATGRGASTTCSHSSMASMVRYPTQCVGNYEDETYSISRADRLHSACPLPSHWTHERPHTRVATFARQAY